MTLTDAEAIAEQVRALGYGAEIDGPLQGYDPYVRVTEAGRYFISLDNLAEFTDFARRYGRAEEQQA